MGGSASPVIANLFMEHFERVALQHSPITPKIWYRFVDDTCVILRKTDTETFFEYKLTKIYQVYLWTRG